MNICCLLMQKNETDLLYSWLLYHGNLVGFNNLHIFDNGSISTETKAILAEAIGFGAHVSYEFADWDGFVRKGEIIGDRILALDRAGEHDFYFPLDADEWLAVDREGEISLERADIERELQTLVGEVRGLAIGYAFDNHPYEPDWFIKSPDQRKCFLASNTLSRLDHGFHEALTLSGDERIKTGIVYIHFHYRQHKALQFYSRQKLEGFVPNFERETLEKYRGPGFHVIGHMLGNEEDYRRSFSTSGRVRLENVGKRYRDIMASRPGQATDLNT